MAYNSALSVGTVLQGPERDYKILYVLGQGGFGITYLVESNVCIGNIELTVQFAVKEHFISSLCVRGTDSKSVETFAHNTEVVKGSLDAFIKEAQRVQSLGINHPNIVKINEVFEANNTAYYVMEYLSGESLVNYINRKGALTEQETNELLLPVIRAISTLHGENLAHYDIKPDNIVLTTDKSGNLRPTLIDFGLAKHYDGQGQATSTTQSRGFSPGYSPIEQYGGIHKFSPQSDVYSIAATIYHCLVGHVPAEAPALDINETLRDLQGRASAKMLAALAKAFSAKALDRQANAGIFYNEITGSNIFVSQQKSSNPVYNDHEYVDLGLPSGLKWATCNVGANSPSEYGDYFAWGETQPKSEYAEYNNDSFGKEIGDISGNSRYDAARANWGGEWRMPTDADFRELTEKCVWTWTVQDGKKGYKVTGPNGNSIFIPATGCRNGSSTYYAGTNGGYWSSTPDMDCGYGFELDFDASNKNIYRINRYYGQTIRPVFGSQKFVENGHEYVDLGLPSGLKWATCNVGANSPSEYGDYFAWGETSPKSKYTKSNNVTNGERIKDVTGNPQYDVARSNWGGEWRLPTVVELEELVNECSWEWTSKNGCDGYKITGPNGKSIFMSAAGRRGGALLDDEGESGRYWSSTGKYDDRAVGLIFDSLNKSKTSYYRSFGFSVRPVFGSIHKEQEIPEAVETENDVFSMEIQDEISLTKKCGHEYVDLGLPSGLKWATCNVGASSPSEYGDSFAWGETSPKSECIKSNSVTYGKEFGDITGNPQYDAARANWGGDWRLPTVAELEELVNKCNWEWSSKNGRDGYKITGPNGKSIFLPAAGERDGTSLVDAGEWGSYMSSTPDIYGDNDGSQYISFDNEDIFEEDWGERYKGFSVRPVWGETHQQQQSKVEEVKNEIFPLKGLFKNGHEYVDLGLPSGLKWATCNVGANSPSEYGDYFAWGETSPKSEYTKNNSVTYGKEYGDIIESPQYDVAKANWGGSWRMPTKDEIQELIDNCDWTWTSLNGTKGYLVKGPTGNKIFMPAVGLLNGTSFDYKGDDGFYWGSTPGSDDRYACSFYYSSSYRRVFNNHRCFGLPVRPVSE